MPWPLFRLSDVFAFQYIYRRTETYEMNEMGGLAKQTPARLLFSAAASLATIGLPGFGNFWGEFGVFLLPLGENLGHAFLDLGSIRNYHFGNFRPSWVARMFFGSATEELVEVESKKPIKDLKLIEMIPAGVILIALLWIGLWPRTISPSIDREIQYRYQSMDNSSSRNSLPPCCPVVDSNGSNPCFRFTI